MSDRPTRPTHLRIAAILAGATALLLIVLGWWFQGWEYSNDPARFAEPTWLAGFASRLLGFLAFGKIGFKVALALVAGSVALLVWLRRSHPQTSTASGGPGTVDDAPVADGSDRG